MPSHYWSKILTPANIATNRLCGEGGERVPVIGGDSSVGPGFGCRWCMCRSRRGSTDDRGLGWGTVGGGGGRCGIRGVRFIPSLVLGSEDTTSNASGDRSNDNNNSYQHDNPPFLLAVPWNRERLCVSLFGRRNPGLQTSVSVDGGRGSRVHRCFAGITRQQVDIVSFLERDRPVESRLRMNIEVGSTRVKERERTDLHFKLCRFWCAVEQPFIVIAAWRVGRHGWGDGWAGG